MCRVGESGREELGEALVLISRWSESGGRAGSDANPEPAKGSEVTHSWKNQQLVHSTKLGMSVVCVHEGGQGGTGWKQG